MSFDPKSNSEGNLDETNMTSTESCLLFKIMHSIMLSDIPSMGPILKILL